MVELENETSSGMDMVAGAVRNPERAKSRSLAWWKNEVFQLNFYRAHMLYFIIVILVSSVIVYGEGIADNDHGVNGPSMSKLRYVDALFLCCSAMTTTGGESSPPFHTFLC